MKRIALGVQYDGSLWEGWQSQLHRKTIQDCLEQALQQFARCPIDTVCAGRTDAGVHAWEQVVHFDTTLSRDSFSWVRGVNAFLPPSIAVRWAHPVELDFHARFSAVARTYHYFLYNHPVRSPLFHKKAGWVFRPLELELMRKGAAYLVGTHDFSAFRSSQCQAKSPVRCMQQISIVQQGNMIIFSLRANAFLHHMVRNIMGALIAVGSTKKTPEWIAETLIRRDRNLAEATFMPDGLYLTQVSYDTKWLLPQQFEEYCTLVYK